MSVTYLKNADKTYDFSDTEIEVDNGSDIWVYYHGSHTLITVDALVVLINASFDTQNSAPFPHFNLDNFETICLVNSTDETTLFTISTLGGVLVDGSANAQAALGCFDKIESGNTYQANGTSSSSMPYWGMSRLPAMTDLLEVSGAPTGGGIEVSTPIEHVRSGEDYIADSGTYSSTYSTVGGFEFPFRYHESQLRSITLFMNEARGQVLEFANDTWSIGRGYDFYLLPHKGAAASTVYAWLDISRKGLYLLKVGDFNEV